MLIADGHLDLAWNALQWNRDLRAPIHAIRTRELGMIEPGRAHNTVCLPEMRAGRVMLALATVLARSTGQPVLHLDYASPEQAYAVGQGQIAYYRALEASGHVRVITNAAALYDHVEAWETWEFTPDALQPPLGLVISMESADPILHADQLGAWWAQGLRVIGPAHYGMGRYAGGTGVTDGFTPAGFALLRQMEAHGALLDLTHLSDRAFEQALDHFGGRVLASHHNCRALVSDQRQLSDDQIRTIQARDGVIGVALDIWMLIPNYTRGRDQRSVGLRTVVEHIDHQCQLAGDALHTAIGSDLDGGFGREQSPRDLDTIADLQRIPDLLSARGYSDAEIHGIAYGNWVRLLSESLPT